MDTKIQRKTETTQSQLVHTKEEKICEISKKQLENKQASMTSLPSLKHAVPLLQVLLIYYNNKTRN